MFIKDIVQDERPRSKAYIDGVKSLTDLELLSIIINAGNKEASVQEIANNVLKLSKSLNGFSNVTVEELSQIKGIGKNKAISILASIELGKRSTHKKKQNLVINSPIDTYNYLKNNYLSHVENVICLYFNQNGTFLHEYVISSGGINVVQLNINEIIKLAIKYSAVYVIMAHNHPSNNSSPSKEDNYTTTELASRLANFDITLVDHVIFTENDFFSYKKENIL